ncbi:MAG TPA: radical SAM family heme chaperone HemW [Myxococcota bacterium]|nr:radical SAM family heme chaperone HemW [Myxococcota bacterium]
MGDASIGVYVHVPFCERVCPYCDFAVVAAPALAESQESRYVDALLRELAARAPDYRAPDGSAPRLESLYLGGGTPSLFTPRSLARIVEVVRAAFDADARVETTLEVNPSTLERSRLREFRALGIDRVSVGAQSFDDAVLKRLGRAHRADEVDRTLAACRDAQFASISLDLMFAAPGQRLAALEADLERALAFAPDHVSSYELSIEPGTPFALAARRGQLELPDEDEAIAMLEHIEVRLGAAGFERYEISNYARPGHAAVHNRRYWERRPVLGLGVGAFSTEPASAAAPFGARRANLRELRGYLDRIARAQPADAGPREVFDAATARGEAVFLALRGARGLVAEEFEREFGGLPRAFFGAAIERLVAARLLEESARGDLRLSARGRLLADAVSAEFV